MASQLDTCYVQILSLTGHLTELPPFRDVVHLILSSPNLLPISQGLRAFHALETLSLTGAPVLHNRTLDVRELPALKHLHLENVAPRKILAPEGCQLHASWDEEAPADDEAWREWLRSSLWTAMTPRLASFWLRSSGLSAEDEETVRELLSRHSPADISLELESFGSQEDAIVISNERWQALLKAKSLRIWAHSSLSVQVSDCRPSWDYLCLECDAELCLRMDNVKDCLQNLTDLMICCPSFRGPVILQIASELTSLGRQWCVTPIPTAHGDMYHLTTVMDHAKSIEFDCVLCCSCRCCLQCLVIEGKIPVGFKLTFRQDCPYGGTLYWGNF